MNRLAISAQTRSPSRCSSSGPGWMPNDTSAASMIAEVALVGSPSESIGTMVPAALALLAASGPATPSMAPRPNSSGCLDSFFSVM